MVKITSAFAAVAALLAATATAHPGHDGATEMMQRRAYMAGLERRDLSHCAAKLRERGIEGKLIARRSELLNAHRKKRGIDTKFLRRDIEDVLSTSHHSDLDVTPETADTDIFASNASCILSPEVTEGPYYVSGELVRSDIRENEDGVDLVVDIQMLDYNTCDPVSGVALDFWHCNTTGVYSGVVASGNGNSADASNINNQALRGIQVSDSDGVVTFETVFPGHYTGRTHHIHVMSHIDAEVLSNDTISGGTVAHVGQIFFDQDLINSVEATSPYTTNTQNSWTRNSQDSIMAEEAASGGDPVVDYVLLGDAVEDGVFAWIAFGIDTTNSRTVSAASSCDASGCHANSGSNSGGNSGGAPGGSGGRGPGGA